MGKKGLKSRKRREQTIAIVIVAAVVLIITAAILIFGASKNPNLGNSEHNHEHDHETTVKDLTLKVAVDAYEGTAHYNAAVKFEEQLESKTGGKIQVEVFPKGKLGDNKTLLKALEENKDVVDIVIAPVSDFVELDARMDISTQPFMFKDADEAWNFMNGEIQKRIEDELLNKNVRVLTHYAGEMTCMLSADKVINNASSVMNMTFAESQRTGLSNALQLLNVRSIVLEGQTLYQALQQKQCDGYFGTLSDIYENHLFQRQTYLAVTNHSYNGLAFAISNDVWKMLGEYQDDVQDLAKSSAYTGRDLIEQQERKMLDKIQSSGVRVIYPDMNSFTEKVESYLRNASPQYGTLMEEHLINKRMNK